MDGGEGETKVLFLSFMRDMAFWREGARKIVCLVFFLFFFFGRERERLILGGSARIGGEE